MHIFIDESGTFALPTGGNVSPCLVGALIVPEHKKDHLFKKYARLRANLPQEGGEVKGRMLNEMQVASVVEWLRRNNCLFEAVCIEMASESAEGIEQHRRGQAESLTANLTDEHYPELVKGVWELRARLEAMALPLYVQSTITHQLLANILEEIPVYWALRQPKENLTFHWAIDGKEIGRMTNAEEWWSSTMCGLLQSKLARTPMIAVEGANYSEFDKKFLMPMPQYLKETILPHEQGYDLRLLMEESFRFSSEPEYGLELVDIVTNATRRALKGNLRREGWDGIPGLMIRRKQHSLKMLTLAQKATSTKLPYRAVLAGPFSNCGRSMLTKRY